MRSLLLAVTLVGVAAVAAVPSYFILDPASFRPLLQEDYDWVTASPGAPLFEASDPNMTFAWFHRWRLYKNHTHAVNETAPSGENYRWVVTEFAPAVPWAGLDNTIPCAAGHHVQDGRWLRDPAIMDSYSTWWQSGLPNVRLNYYFWHAQSLLARLEVAGPAANLELVARVLPRVADLVAAYANGTLPGHGDSSKFLAGPPDCVYNDPGNEGEENSISGPGCRPLVQALLYGEYAALSALCSALGNATCAAEYASLAASFRRRVYALWNAGISSFDTARWTPTPTPAPTPPPGYTLFTNASIFCCDQSPCVGGHSSFLYQGPVSMEQCVALCNTYAAGLCHYITVSLGESPWCMNAQFCNATNPFAGAPAYTFAKDAVHVNSETAAPSSPRAAPLPPPFAQVRELASLSSPWFHHAVDDADAPAYAASWETAFDTEGLGGAFGLRTAEARNPGYDPGGSGCCHWNGPMWPYESSKALRAAVDILQNAALSAAVPALTRTRLWGLLAQYTALHVPGIWIIQNGSSTATANYATLNASGLFFSGLGTAWVAEAGDPDSARWTDDPTEGYKYNHAHFIDLIVGAVAGLQPHAAGPSPPSVTVQPLQPSDAALSWWALDGAVVNGRVVTVLWDVDGSRYGRGAGLSVFIDGVQAAHAATTQGPPLVVPL